MKCNAVNLSVYSITEKGSLEVEPLICSPHPQPPKGKKGDRRKIYAPDLWAYRILLLFT